MGYDLSPAPRAEFLNELLTQDTRSLSEIRLLTGANVAHYVSESSKAELYVVVSDAHGVLISMKQRFDGSIDRSLDSPCALAIGYVDHHENLLISIFAYVTQDV